MTLGTDAMLLPTDGGPWDLLVVGGGTAGMVAARTAAGFGASVLLAERDRLGGDCLWTGCVPSKALLASAGAAAAAREAIDLGVEVGDVRVDFAAVMGHVKAAIAEIEPDDSVPSLARAGVHVVPGEVSFTGRTSATVDGRAVPFRQAVVATGSEPVLPPIPGLAAAQPLTSDTVWSLPALPGQLAVIGGGSIGCELGQAFARLGSRVTLVEAAARTLTSEDADAAAVISDALRRDGVEVRTATEITAVHPSTAGAGSLELADGTHLPFDTLLVAVGRRPRTDTLGLDRAGVSVDPRGHVAVDSHLRTSNPRIWAAGDVTGHPAFTHAAGVHASVAAANAVLGLRRRAEVTSVPRVTFTSPELAAVGIGTGDANGHPGLRVRHVAGDAVDRAVTDRATEGFTRLVLDRKGRILGATVVGPRAGEAIAELVLAVRRGLRTRDLAGTIHAYPTYTYGPWDAAIEDVREALGRGPTARLIHSLARARRGWLDLRQRPR